MLKNRKYNEIFKLDYYLNGTINDIFYYLTDTGIHGQSIQYDINGAEFLMKYSGERRVVSMVDIMYQHAIDSGLTEKQSAELISEGIAKTLADRYREKWARIHDALFAVYNPIENYNSEEKRTPNLTHETKNTGDDKTSISSDSDVTTKASSFDSPDMEDVTKVVSNSNPTNNYSKVDYNSTSTVKDTGTDTITKHGNIGTTKTQEMINDEIAMRNQQDFIDIVYGDIGAYLLSNIY